MNIYEQLCHADKRHPDHKSFYDEDDNPTPRGNCTCDNCFHGHDALALIIIELLGGLEDAIETISDLELETDGESQCFMANNYRELVTRIKTKEA